MSQDDQFVCPFCPASFPTRKGRAGHIGALSRSKDGIHRASLRVGASRAKVPAEPKTVEERILAAEQLVREANERMAELMTENAELREALEAIQARYDSEHFAAQFERMEKAEEQLRKNLETDRKTKGKDSWWQRRQP